LVCCCCWGGGAGGDGGGGGGGGREGGRGDGEGGGTVGEAEEEGGGGSEEAFYRFFLVLVFLFFVIKLCDDYSGTKKHMRGRNEWEPTESFEPAAHSATQQAGGLRRSCGTALQKAPTRRWVVRWGTADSTDAGQGSKCACRPNNRVRMMRGMMGVGG